MKVDDFGYLGINFSSLKINIIQVNIINISIKYHRTSQSLRESLFFLHKDLKHQREIGDLKIVFF